MRADPDRLLDLLQRWEGHWRAVDAPVVGLLQDGLSDQEIDDLTAPLGLRLPIEARVLFRWHNGTPLVPGLPATTWITGPGLEFESLQRAVITTHGLRDLAATTAQDSPDFLVWEESWFAVMRGIMSAERVAIDTAVAEGQTAPIGMKAWEETKAPDPDRTFTDLVALWVRCMDDGTYTWVPEDTRWDKPWPPPAHIPPLFHDYYL